MNIQISQNRKRIMKFLKKTLTLLTTLQVSDATALLLSIPISSIRRCRPFGCIPSVMLVSTWSWLFRLLRLIWNPWLLQNLCVLGSLRRLNLTIPVFRECLLARVQVGLVPWCHLLLDRWLSFIIHLINLSLKASKLIHEFVSIITEKLAPKLHEVFFRRSTNWMFRSLKMKLTWSKHYWKFVCSLCYPVCS